ncbi:MAG: OmpA family protein [Thermodesulfobacteriota bacterium]
MVKVDANALSAEIDRTGHASIYGILFDTDKAEVKPESKQALGEIAKLLKQRAELKLYVVGHTDSVGSLDYNLDLSRRRAASVVKVLVQDYGIDRKRLKPAGVGPLAPVLANSSDGGRAKNRRVELVKQ